MRLLILSDIHANLEGLAACLEAAGSWDQLANLGDTVGYGADPNAVIERVRDCGGLRVRGNHDRGAVESQEPEDFNPIAAQALRWTRNYLAPKNLDWLRTLSPGPVYEPALANTEFVHGSPAGEDEYILNLYAARDALQRSPSNIIFFGHTHVQGVVERRPEEVHYIQPTYAHKHGVAERCDVALERGGRYLINPGSVGQPRDGDWRAAFAIYDSGAKLVSLWRVPYDVALAQQKILAAGLPDRLATRLREGR